MRNSPADRVPSHGTEAFASARAVDLVPVDADGRTGRVTLRTWLAPEAPEHFPGYGRAVIAPCDGVVVSVFDDTEDHGARRGLPSLAYALTQGRRVLAGWRSLAGNHVILQATDGPFVALCHLRRGSAAVVVGDRVRSGQLLAECGNSGNSTEPHLHLQAMTQADPSVAHPVAVTLVGRMPRTGEVVQSAPSPGP